jgi:hypothetical protein
MEGYVLQEGRLFILIPPSPFLWKILSCLFESQMEVCKKAIRVLGEGLLRPFESIGLNMMGE